MTPPTPVSSRKRPSPDDGARSHDSSTRELESSKRQRTSSLTTELPSGLRLLIPSKNVPVSPPLSTKGPATMTLKLIIPHQNTNIEQQKRLNRRRADAERWKSKLQRPYPKSREIKAAYSLKLMRHYPDAKTSTQLDFIRPRIDKSTRVSHLLERFPLMKTAHASQTSYEVRSSSPASPADQAIPLRTRRDEFKEAQSAHVELLANKQITGGENAQRLAWQSFSLPETGRIDRGREAMMQSGLITDDLKLEAAGKWNRLPEWKKYCTGRFAGGRQAAG